MTVNIVVPYRADGGQRDRVWAWCKARWRAILPWAEIIESDSGHQPFHRGASINRGVRLYSASDWVIIADADTAISEPTRLGCPGPWTIGYQTARYFPLDVEQTDLLLHRLGDYPAFMPPEPPRALGITAWSGVIAMPRAAFDAVGGFDERFHGWGWEDRAFVHAADTLFGKHSRAPGFALHLWHPRGPEWTSPGIKDRENLWRRYAAADGNREAMRAILAEAR